MLPTASEPARGLTLPARRLNPAERARLAAEILACYLRVAISLRGAEPIEQTVRRLRGGPGSRTPLRTGERHGVSEALRLGGAVIRTLEPLPGDTRCLVRSLVLTRLLARRGLASTLVIGARTTPSFLAHAWVEHRGVAILDPGGGQFARLTEL